MYEEEKNNTEQLSHESKSEAPLKQLTLEESSSRTKVWDASDPRAIEITTKVGEMIALDCQSRAIISPTWWTILDLFVFYTQQNQD